MANIKHGDHRHSSVAEVRACGTTIGSQTYADPDPPSGGLSGPQRWRIEKELKAREVPEKISNVIRANLNSYDRSRASRVIDALNAYPLKPETQTNQGPGKYPEFTDGYYALREEDGAVHFYHLIHDSGERNPKYRGWPVVLAQASDDLHLIRNRDRKVQIIDDINKDPQAARLLYSDELGNCYICGRTLTDETSRRLGIGPVCRGKYPTLVHRAEANDDAA